MIGCFWVCEPHRPLTLPNQLIQDRRCRYWSARTRSTTHGIWPDNRTSFCWPWLLNEWHSHQMRTHALWKNKTLAWNILYGTCIFFLHSCNFFFIYKRKVGLYNIDNHNRIDNLKVAKKRKYSLIHTNSIQPGSMCFSKKLKFSSSYCT